MVIVQRIDDYGTPAWIAVTVLGFAIWWPVGLATLAYALGSGRIGSGRIGSGQMACGNRSVANWESRVARMQEKVDRMRSRMSATGNGQWWPQASSGNRAFDDYREETFRRLEEEQREFHAFLDRLRVAKDRQEFDAFMAERRGNTQPPTDQRQV